MNDCSVFGGICLCLTVVTASGQTQESVASRAWLGPASVAEASGIEANAEVQSGISLPAQDIRLFIEEGRRLLPIDTREIFGGHVAGVGEFPWQVSIGWVGVPIQNGHFCGGALVGVDRVLTAAHCLKGLSSNQLKVVSGTNVLGNGGQEHSVVEIDRHDWTDGAFTNDIAILRIEPASASTFVELLPPALEDQLASPGHVATVSGWGLKQESGFNETALRSVDVEVVSNADCNDSDSYNGSVTESMVCAGPAAGGAGHCRADSGGPLVVPANDEMSLLLGIVSWSEGCAEPEKYGVYTRVPSFFDWITERL